MIILFLVFAILRARAAPFSAGPVTDPTIAHAYLFGVQPRAVGSEANMRTMYDVIKSCFITIGACVYRAIHQNIPDPSLTFWGRLRVRAKITFYALIAPELMIWWAMRQRFGAKIVIEHINERIPGLKWTLTHGQFIQMGGFVRNDNKQVLLHSDITGLFEDGRIGLTELAQITKEDIQDKSKGDILSKSVVAFQTTWFVFECIARLQQGLPLLELEVVTLAFAILNVITYFLWWHKPLDVLRPIFIRIKPDQSEEVASRRSGSVDHAATEQDLQAGLLVNQGPNIAEDNGMDATFKPIVAKVGIVTRAKGAMARVGDAIVEDIRRRPWYMTIWKRLIKEPFIAIILPLLDLTGNESSSRNTGGSVQMFSACEIPFTTGAIVLLLSSFIGLMFGAIHFISWNGTFPTHSQLLLWRVSSIIMVGEPAILLLGALLALTADHIPKIIKDVASALVDIIDDLQSSQIPFVKYPTRVLILIGFGAVAITPMLYVLARSCVIVLAFLTLRDLPTRALDTISWTSYIPHI